MVKLRSQRRCCMRLCVLPWHSSYDFIACIILKRRVKEGVVCVLPWHCILDFIARIVLIQESKRELFMRLALTLFPKILLLALSWCKESMWVLCVSCLDIVSSDFIACIVLLQRVNVGVVCVLSWHCFLYFIACIVLIQESKKVLYMCLALTLFLRFYCLHCLDTKSQWGCCVCLALTLFLRFYYMHCLDTKSQRWCYTCVLPWHCFSDFIASIVLIQRVKVGVVCVSCLDIVSLDFIACSILILSQRGCCVCVLFCLDIVS